MSGEARLRRDDTSLRPAQSVLLLPVALTLRARSASVSAQYRHERNLTVPEGGRGGRLGGTVALCGLSINWSADYQRSAATTVGDPVSAEWSRELVDVSRPVLSVVAPTRLTNTLDIGWPRRARYAFRMRLVDVRTGAEQHAGQQYDPGHLVLAYGERECQHLQQRLSGSHQHVKTIMPNGHQGWRACHGPAGADPRRRDRGEDRWTVSDDAARGKYAVGMSRRALSPSAAARRRSDAVNHGRRSLRVSRAGAGRIECR